MSRMPIEWEYQLNTYRVYPRLHYFRNRLFGIYPRFRNVIKCFPDEVQDDTLLTYIQERVHRFNNPARIQFTGNGVLELSTLVEAAEWLDAEGDCTPDHKPTPMTPTISICYIDIDDIDKSGQETTRHVLAFCGGKWKENKPNRIFIRIDIRQNVSPEELNNYRNEIDEIMRKCLSISDSEMGRYWRLNFNTDEMKFSKVISEGIESEIRIGFEQIRHNLKRLISPIPRIKINSNTWDILDFTDNMLRGVMHKLVYHLDCDAEFVGKTMDTTSASAFSEVYMTYISMEMKTVLLRSFHVPALTSNYLDKMKFTERIEDSASDGTHSVITKLKGVWENALHGKWDQSVYTETEDRTAQAELKGKASNTEIEDKTLDSEIEDQTAGAEIEDRTAQAELKGKASNDETEDKTPEGEIEDQTAGAEIEDKISKAEIEDNTLRAEIEIEHTTSETEREDKTPNGKQDYQTQGVEIEDKIPKAELEDKTPKDAVEEKTTRRSGSEYMELISSLKTDMSPVISPTIDKASLETDFTIASLKTMFDGYIKLSISSTYPDQHTCSVLTALQAIYIDCNELISSLKTDMSPVISSTIEKAMLEPDVTSLKKMVREVDGYISMSIKPTKISMESTSTDPYQYKSPVLTAPLLQAISSIPNVFGHGMLHDKLEIHVIKLDTQVKTAIANVLERHDFCKDYAVKLIKQMPKLFADGDFTTGTSIKGRLGRGTAGGYARGDTTDDVYALTCAHVVSNMVADEDVLILDNMTYRLLGRSSPQRSLFSNQGKPLMDFAAVKVNDSLKGRCIKDCWKDESGRLQPGHLVTGDPHEMQFPLVYKYGATTGCTSGTVVCPDYAVGGDSHLVMIETLPGDTGLFADDGDSGSVVCAPSVDVDAVNIVSMVTSGPLELVDKDDRQENEKRYLTLQLSKGVDQMATTHGLRLTFK